MRQIPLPPQMAADPAMASWAQAATAPPAVRSVAADYQATGADCTLLCDATAAPVTVTLPQAAKNAGQTITAKKIDASGHAVTVDGYAADKVDGAATYALTLQYESVTVQSDGSGWWVL